MPPSGVAESVATTSPAAAVAEALTFRPVMVIDSTFAAVLPLIWMSSWLPTDATVTPSEPGAEMTGVPAHATVPTPGRGR